MKEDTINANPSIEEIENRGKRSISTHNDLHLLRLINGLNTSGKQFINRIVNTKEFQDELKKCGKWKCWISN